RGDFRLQTNPLYDVKLIYGVKDQYESKNNVLNIQGGYSETKLFRNFLKMVGQSDDGGVIDISFKVQDISAGGAAILISEIEKEIFKKDTIVENVILRFKKNDEIVIPKSKVTYCI